MTNVKKTQVIVGKLLFTGFLASSLPRVSAWAEFRPSYGDIRGARFQNSEAGTWDVGWGGGKDFPEGIEGIYLVDFSEDGKPAKFTGGKEFRLSDSGAPGTGIPVPRLGVSVDIRIEDGATGDWRQKIFADDGKTVYEGWRRRYRTKRRVPPGAYRDVYRLLDSRKLDGNSDGFWSPDVLRDMNSYDVPAGLDYTLILPATWFDVPAPSRSGDTVRTYRTLRFGYLDVEGETEAEISLREDYVNPDGSLKIGFVHSAGKDEKRGRYIRGGRSVHKVYVVQSCAKGGVIIARLDKLKSERYLQIVSGTLDVSEKGESVLPRYGKKVSYYQMESFPDYMSNTPEFSIYGYSLICNTLTCRMWRSLVYPHNLLWDDPYVRRRVKEDVARWQHVVDTCKRYGMDFLYETHPVFIPDFVVFYPQFISESYDTKTGEFPKAFCNRHETRDVYRTDAESPEARMLMEKHWTEFFSYFERLPYVEVVEAAVKGRLQKGRIRIGEEVYCYGGPFYSPAALKSYRDFAGDPAARFPVAPDDKETDRTFCTTDKNVWDHYREWVIDAYTEGSIMVILRGAYEAFKGNPSYKGFSYMQGAYPVYDQTALLDLRKVIGHPSLAWFVNEHGWLRRKRETTRELSALIKKHSKKQIMLTNAFKFRCGPGPGELPKDWSDGLPRCSWLRPAEMLWKKEKMFGHFPELDGIAWHAGFFEDAYRFWTAYQTVEWDRGLMPMREAAEIVGRARKTYNRYRADFDYDINHAFKTLRIKKEDEGFNIFEKSARDLAGAPEHIIRAPEAIFRGTVKDNIGAQASFRVVAAGLSKVCVFIEVRDAAITADPRKYAFPIGEGWPWKDKVDVFLGFAETPFVRIRGEGGVRPPPDKPRYTHVLGPYGGTAHRKTGGNTLWVEARCGEEQIACYYRRQRNPKDLRFGRAEWVLSPQDKKWSGRIEINLEAIDEQRKSDKLTGFNLGVQDVDEPCDFMGRVRRGGKPPFYMLYETYPWGAHDTARYAGIEWAE